MSRIANDILEDVAFHLIEPVVDTTVALAISSGSQVVTPDSVKGIYVGAKLLIARAGVNEEVATVTAVTATTFTAIFANSHTAGVAVNGATFPSGQTDHPLFTQAEMLAYLEDVQNDFLLKIQPVYNTADVTIIGTTRDYAQPAATIRMERISIAGKQLFNTTQSDLDLNDPNWPSVTSPPVPTDWYQDMIETAKFGVFPLPQVGETAEVWFSEKETATLDLDTTLLVPDVFTHYLKYGTLERAWSKDGEQRDPQRAEYCNRRYRLGLFVAKKFMEGSKVEPPHRDVSIARPAPMAVPAG